MDDVNTLQQYVDNLAQQDFEKEYEKVVAQNALLKEQLNASEQRLERCGYQYVSALELNMSQINGLAKEAQAILDECVGVTYGSIDMRTIINLIRGLTIVEETAEQRLKRLKDKSSSKSSLLGQHHKELMDKVEIYNENALTEIRSIMEKYKNGLIKNSDITVSSVGKYNAQKEAQLKESIMNSIGNLVSQDTVSDNINKANMAEAIRKTDEAMLEGTHRSDVINEAENDNTVDLTLNDEEAAFVDTYLNKFKNLKGILRKGCNKKVNECRTENMA